MDYTKPLPVPTEEDGPFWAAAREHRLVLPRCRRCGHTWFPPYSRCDRCLSNDREWIEASGRGEVFGYTIFERSYLRAFNDVLPYNVVLVQLEEGPLLYSNLVDVDNDEIRAGLAVRVVFDNVTDDVTLPKFTPVA